MPHIKVDLSENIADRDMLQPLLQRLAQRLGEFEDVESGAVKAYLSIRDAYAANDDGKPSFGHVEVALLPGRSTWIRSKIAAAMHEIMADVFSEPWSNGTMALTVEVREMDFDTYKK